MEIIVCRRNDEAFEAMFNDLTQEVFGFSFAPWFEMKLWDERYETYGIVQDGKMLSSACIFKIDILVNGQAAKSIQFGAVATRKSERGKGLSRRLMEHVLSQYPDTPAHLAANPTVVDFYPRFGFRQVQFHKPEIAVRINNDPSKAVQYEYDDDEVMEALASRGAYSNMVDCLNTDTVRIFHMMIGYDEDIYFLPNCGALVVAKQKESRLFLADVITQKPITFDALRAELPFENVDIVEFGFCPDHLGVSPIWVPSDMAKEPFFIKGNWNLPEKFRFPIMSET
ncbi:MAG: GNAT family N-acetyltransferase [Defluviitaleaceae bacterium]|nr:GNAT family N-acetyltransferase [Defluviitaleaceae bacterium]